MKFEKVQDLTTALQESMDAEHDQREMARECDHFINKKDGMWEPDIIQKLNGRPRYTFDMTNPIIEQVVGEIRNNDFSLRASAAGGGADKKVASVYDGLIKNIRNISDADMIFDNAAEAMIGTSFSAWEITHDYLDSDSFHQDLIIKPISGAIDRVWYETNSRLQTREDAKWVVKLTKMTKKAYDKEFPKGSGMSVGDDDSYETYSYKADTVTVGQVFYKTYETKTLYLMSNGAVYEESEDFNSVRDELELSGIVVEDQRERKVCRVKSRMFDGKDWLTPEEDTVFSYLPIVPVYCNFRLSEGKVIYSALTRRVMDQQRLLNFAASREVEEVALAPKPFYWATKKQIEGHEDEVQRMNIDGKPVRTFTPDSEMPGPPQQAVLSPVNQALQLSKQFAMQAINQSAGLFNASMGDNANLQSGIAISQQVDRGNNGTIQYFAAMQVAISHTGKVLVDAIPRVYNGTRQVRIVGDDGTSEMVTINQPVQDRQTGKIVYLNDLTVGKYDVVCDIGPAFKTRMDETNAAFTEMVRTKPELADVGLDLWAATIDAPGMDKLAERLRGIAIQNGVIPMEQLTDEERAAIEQQQATQQEQPDPNMIALQIQNTQANTAFLAEQNEAERSRIKMLELTSRMQGQQEKMQVDIAEKSANIEQSQQKIDLQAQQQQFAQMLEMQRMAMEAQKAQADQISTLANALNSLRDAMGADAVINQSAIKAYDDVAGMTEGKAGD